MGKLFNKILCPITFDDSSMEALDLAGKLADQSGAAVCVMHVVFGTLSRAGDESIRAALEGIALERLGSAVAREFLIESGEPATLILAAARRLNADLIAMATHGRKGGADALLGSVAERVLRGAKQPVLVVRPKPVAGAELARKAARDTQLS
jgi:nucleotide-binding universal stress UspA family protein